MRLAPSQAFRPLALLALLAAPTLGQRELQKLLSGGSQDDVEMGRILRFDGDVAAIGAPGRDLNGDNSGAVYVYRRLFGEWHEEAVLTGGDTVAGDGFGSAIALEGHRLLVGAHLHDTPQADSGAVYVFEFDGLEWAQVQKITQNTPFADEGFGLGLGPEGDELILGAPCHGGGLFQTLTFEGRASAGLALPPGSSPALVGQTMHSAAVVLDLVPLTFLHATEAVATSFSP